MAAGYRRLMSVLMLCGVAGISVWLAWPSGGAPATGAKSASVLSGPRSRDSWVLGSFAVPGVQEIDGNQQASDAEWVRHASPAAFVARERSRMEFARLGAVQAARVAREVFPALVEKREGGMPALPVGEKLRRFSARNVAQIYLPGHARGVVESIEPLAIRTASGRFEPVDLALKDEGSSFVPSASPVTVRISKRLRGGVRAPRSGVSLTPIGARGEALGGSEGSVDGASVMYANTQSDTDTLAKPTSRGFELSAILRSEASPHDLYYRVGLPGGASLVQHQRGGPVQVVKDGEMVGMIPPPTAVDAAGTGVSVTMTVNGDLLAMDAQPGAGEYRYPVQVDPEYVTGEDRSLTGGVWPVEHPKEGETNWVPIFSSAFSEKRTYEKHFGLEDESDQSWYIDPLDNFNANEVAGLRYRTQGESTIYNLEMSVEGENQLSQTATVVEYRYNKHEGKGEEEGQDNHKTLSEGIHQTRYEYKPLSMTSGYSNNPLETPRENDVRLMDYTTQQGYAYGFWTSIYDAHVYVAQEDPKYPEVESTSACKQCGFNTSSSTIEKAGDRTNVLYGSGSWLSPYQGAFEATVRDPGVGISLAAFTGELGYHAQRLRDEENLKHEPLCLGIQCPEIDSDSMTYNESMPNGEYGAEFFAEDSVGLTNYAYSYSELKVDASKPYNLGFTGMPEVGAEINAVPHTLTVHATDGKKPTPSSGIRSISVSIDGGTPTELAGASCPRGECTASGTYTFDAENLSEGVHRLVVSAVSNSSEPEADEFLFDVRHASPVSVGPGSVDPTTGEFRLMASDVSLGGASGVSRSYQSRNLTAGASGPLGPQWTMSVGGGEGLTVLPSGSVVLASGSGGTTTFTLNSKGEFEAPKGDENLKIEYKAAERKYVLTDANAGSETVFEQPSGTQSTPPTFGGAFGAETGVLNRPVSDAVDGSGDVWVTDWTDGRIAEFTSRGTLIGTHGFEGSESAELREPFGIAINQRTGDIYVSDYGNSRIDEFSPSGTFIRAFGWGVANGEAALQACTSSCRAGLGGGGAGQISGPDGITIDPSGNVWVTEEGNDRVQEFNETGGYITAFGSAGSGAGQFETPMDIAFAGSDLYVTDQNNNRVDEFSTAGAFIKAMGWGVSNGEGKIETCTSSCQAGIAGNGSGQFDAPRGLTVDPMSGNLYVINTDSDCLQEDTTAGAFVVKVCSDGSGPGQFNGPMGVAVSSAGAIYLTDFNNSRVQEWSRSAWLPTSAKGSLPSQSTYVYTPVENSEGAAAMQPYEVLSPTPTGISCGTKPEELKEEKDKGCRALTFRYATETTAEGEKWGGYKGHLSQVMFHTWNPSTKAMEEKPVAEYSYDKQGRLRAEWDPRIEKSTGCGSGCSALTTTYGYDAEGHVTALTPPAEQPWTFTYGPIAGDDNAGRLLKVTRAYPKAGESEAGIKTRLAEQKEAPENTGAPPMLSGTSVVGVKMGVSHGSWSKSPIAYGYQWEDCNSEGKACVPILGATNANYKVASSDVGYTLVARVTAMNGWGAVMVVSAASAVVSSSGTHTEGTSYAPEPGSTIEYRVPLSPPEYSGLPNMTKEEVEKWGQKDEGEYEDNDPVEGMAVIPPDEPQGWPASNYERATIDYLNEKGLTVNTASPTGGITTTEYNELNEIVRTLSADNRAAAMKEGCKSVSKKECKSTEVSEKLDTKTEYGVFGSDILKVVGPEHEVKLSTGEEVEARAVTHNYYDEGAQEAEEKNKETYNLVTKTTSGALLSNGEEKDVRTELTSYSGQNDLGWKLRKPTSTTLEPAGLDLVHKTIYEEHENSKKEMESTGDVVETRAPAGNSEQVSPPSFSSRFGGSGSGNGQFKEPWAIALDSGEDVWVADYGNDRVEKFTASGGFTAEYGKEGTGDTEFREPLGIAVNQTTGNVYVADSQNNRIEELTSSGGFVEAIGWGVSDGKSGLEVCKSGCKAGNSGTGNGQLAGPAGLMIDSHGNIWVADKGNNRVQEFSEAGAYLSQFGSPGSGNGQFNGPAALTMSEGSVYVVDRGNGRVEQFSVYGSYMSQFASKGKNGGQLEKPVGIAANPSTGALYVCDYENERMEEFSPAGKFLTEWETWGSTHEQSFPAGVAVGATGKLYIVDPWANDVGAWIPPESGGAHLSFSTQFGSEGTSKGQFKEPVGTAIDGEGDVWVTDYGNDRVEKFGPDGSVSAAYGKEGSGKVQFHGPTGIAINKSTGDVYIADTWNNRVEELSSKGKYVTAFGTSGLGTLKQPAGIGVDSAGNVWIADEGNDRLVEFSSTGTYIAAYGQEGSGEVQFNKPAAVGFSGENIYVADSANHRIEELTSKGAYVRAWGVDGEGSGEFYAPEGIAVDAAGNLYISDYAADQIQEFSPSGAYRATFGGPGNGEGQFSHPEGVAMDAAGDLYVVDQGDNRVERWDNNAQAAHDVKTAYYSAKEESTVAACRNRPEWANLPCQTEPAAQPDHGLPELPVITVASYNIWDEVEKTEEKFGNGSKAVTRTKTETYDSAGRALTSEETLSPETEKSDKPLPKVTDEYNAETGAVEKQSTGERSISSRYSTLGQLVEYRDASGNVAKYGYEEGGDGRLEEVSEGKGEEAESSQTYSYDSHTGLMDELVDSTAGTFTASYDVEGRMTGENYPNYMRADYTINSVGETTSLVYEKWLAYCATKCPEVWFSDSVVPSIHGETLQQTSSLSKENYAYDSDGRLSETQETPAGKGCAERLYAYEEESNRTSETTREPGTEGKCATEGGTVERHTYDEANRLTDEGVEYEPFGNTTKMPAGDAGGHELVSTYYVDNQVATEEQNKQLDKYTYDPAGRTLETFSEKGTKKAALITHYAGSGNALTWTCEEEGVEGKKECSEGTGKWTRNIPGIDGALDAIEEDGKVPVLQLHDLEGNIVGTVADKQTITKLASTYNSLEFGVPSEGKAPPKYAWLGAAGVSTEISFGSGVATQGGESYVPQVARALQTEPVIPPGAFPNGSPGTQFTAAIVTAAAIAGAQEIGAQFWQKAETERQKAKEEEEKKQLEQCQAEGGCGAEVYVDPTHEFLVSPLAAIEYGEVLCDCAVVGDAGDALEEIFGGFGGKIAETILAGGALESFGKQLRVCGEILKGNSLNRCRITVHTLGVWTPFGTVDTFIPISIGIDACYFFKKAYNGPHGYQKRGLNCPGKYYGEGI